MVTAHHCYSARLFDHLTIPSDRELFVQIISLPLLLGRYQQRGLVVREADLIGSEPVLD